ncbi:MAG TPA: endonuclease III domain-containing protein [Candidatus Angelobacter sp.]|nr:endonuclease III domain-containing protein [Candidatus Angelobacter sp.]
MTLSHRQKQPAETVRRIYRQLSRAWGPQHWWPAESAFEVIVGAVLTQNTSWINVERAMANLRAADALHLAAIRSLAVADLEQLIRPSGYFRQKAARLKDFVAFVDASHAGSLQAMLATPTPQLREQLLAQRGIGPETADSILLYAGQHPVFVVDAYTRRVLERHDAVAASGRYDDIRELVELALQAEPPPPASDTEPLHANRPAVHAPSAMSTAARANRVQVFNEMHGLFVQLGKHFCSKRAPKCETCPLGGMLTHPVGDIAPAVSRRAASLANQAAPRKRAKPRV